MAIESTGTPVFVSGPAGPATTATAANLTDVVAAIKAALTAPDLATARTALGLGIGVSVQAWSATLDALAVLATSAFGRSLLTQADAPTALGTLGAAASARQVLTPSIGGLQGGGDLTADRTLAIAANGVANAMLAQAGAGTLKANLLGATANVTDQTLSAILDALLGATRGAIAVRGASTWGALALGTSGYTLQSNGTDLVFAAASPGAGAVRNDTAQNPGAALIAQALANVGALFTPQGRLTLTSGLPVLGAAVAAAGTVYYTPVGGDLTLVGTGLTTAPVPVVFAETSQALSDTAKSPAAAVAAMGYDYFTWADGTTVRCTRGPAWTAGATAGTWTAGGTCARGTGAGSTELVRVGGVLVNKNAITNGPAAGMGVFQGTIMTDASGATVTFQTGGISAGGTAAWIGLWNLFNREPVAGQIGDTTASWTYSTTSWRMADASAGMRVTFVVGWAGDPWRATYAAAATGATSGPAAVGVGIDKTAGSDAVGGFIGAPQNTSTLPATAVARGLLGQHFLQATEFGNTNGVTFYGLGANVAQTGMTYEGRF